MAAIINSSRPGGSTSANSFSDRAKPELIQKIEGQIARVTALRIFNSDDAFLTINEDKSLRVLLRRDGDKFWPSAIEYLPTVPSSLCLDEQSKTIFVGLVNGIVLRYALSEDMNKMDMTGNFHGHTHTVTSVIYSPADNMLFTCSRDKSLSWFTTDREINVKLGGHNIDSPCTMMQFDINTKFIFLGDYSGNVYVLRISGNNVQEVSKLSAHTAAISDLAWDANRQVLFSASNDHLVIMWDIGGQKGHCYELNGHDSKLSCLALASNASKLFSIDDTGHLVCWDLKPKRSMAPPWHESDRCEICDTPFFWNLKVMWDRKTIGLRRHHCRLCGMSVCASCCNQTTVFPQMGYEKPARICKTCSQKMKAYPEQFDLTPLALQTDLKQGVIDMDLNAQSGKLATVGYDRVIMVWNVRSML